METIVLFLVTNKKRRGFDSWYLHCCYETLPCLPSLRSSTRRGSRMTVGRPQDGYLECGWHRSASNRCAQHGAWASLWSIPLEGWRKAPPCCLIEWVPLKSQFELNTGVWKNLWHTSTHFLVLFTNGTSLTGSERSHTLSFLYAQGKIGLNISHLSACIIAEIAHCIKYKHGFGARWSWTVNDKWKH